MPTTEHHRFNIWARMPVWARFITALAVIFGPPLLVPSMSDLWQGVLMWGFIIGVIVSIVLAIERKIR